VGDLENYIPEALTEEILSGLSIVLKTILSGMPRDGEARPKRGSAF